MTSTYTGYIRDDDDTDGSILTGQQAGKMSARGAGANSRAVANTPNTPVTMTGSAAVADTFDAAAFDALPLRDKLDRAAHASLAFRMALIASTDVATATDARIKVALSAAQSILPLKVRINETEFHAKLPDRTAEHLARWEALKRDPAGIAIKERIAREEAARASRAAADAAMKERELKHDVIDGQPVVAGSSSAITGNS